MNTTPLDLSRLRVLPLAERESLTRADDILLDPDAPPRAAAPTTVDEQVDDVRRAGSWRPAGGGQA